MSEAHFTVANRSGSASPEEIANRREAIHNFIRARITDAATVDDLTQEVLVKAQRAGSSLKDSAKLEGWMFRIARNMIADRFRNSKKLVIFSSDAGSPVGPDIALFTQEQESRKAHLLRCVPRHRIVHPGAGKSQSSPAALRPCFCRIAPGQLPNSIGTSRFRRHLSSRTGEALWLNGFCSKIQSSAGPSQVARFDR